MLDLSSWLQLSLQLRCPPALLPATPRARRLRLLPFRMSAWFGGSGFGFGLARCSCVAAISRADASRVALPSCFRWARRSIRCSAWNASSPAASVILVSKCKVRGQGRKRSMDLECTIAEYHVEALSIGLLE